MNYHIPPYVKEGKYYYTYHNYRNLDVIKILKVGDIVMKPSVLGERVINFRDLINHSEGITDESDLLEMQEADEKDLIKVVFSTE